MFKTNLPSAQAQKLSEELEKKFETIFLIEDTTDGVEFVPCDVLIRVVERRVLQFIKACEFGFSLSNDQIDKLQKQLDCYLFFKT